jgi:hypothetical protein
VGITFSRLSLSYWIDNLGFITEGKLATIFIKTFSWGFPTGRHFYFINSAPSDMQRENLKDGYKITNLAEDDTIQTTASRIPT